MATSGSTNFNLTRNEIIFEALEILNVVGVGEAAASEDVTSASRSLNLLIKSWQNQGYHLWGITDAVLIPQVGTEVYSLPGAYASNTVIKTELASAAAASATSLTVDSTANMTVSDVIIIELDDDTLHVTTVATIPSSTTLTITSGLASAASVDNHVYTYTTALGRPVRIEEARYRDASGLDQPLQMLSRDEYLNISNKSSAGIPSSYYYNPQLSTAKLYLWPVPNDAQGRVCFSYNRTLEDFDASSNNSDLPQEWLLALVWNLALLLAPKFEVDTSKIERIIRPQALLYLADAMAYDNENGSVQIMPDQGN